MRIESNNKISMTTELWVRSRIKFHFWINFSNNLTEMIFVNKSIWENIDLGKNWKLWPVFMLLYGRPEFEPSLAWCPANCSSDPQVVCQELYLSITACAFQTKSEQNKGKKWRNQFSMTVINSKTRFCPRVYSKIWRKKQGYISQYSNYFRVIRNKQKNAIHHTFCICSG